MIILIIKTLILSFVITKFEPLQWLFDLLRPKFEGRNISNLIFNAFYLATGCFKCCSLYVGFIIGGFWIGIISSIIAYLYLQLLAPKIEKITLQ